MARNPQRQLMVELEQNFFTDAGNFFLFNLRFFREMFFPPYDFRELIKQCYKIGVKTLMLVSITGFIMGLVLTLQSQPTLADFGAESWLPAMVSVSIIREIGPVITSLICAGKVASGIGAELGSMKVTEQIDAMEVSGTKPFKFLVVTRVLATTFMVPLLVIYSDFVAMAGSFIGVNITGEVSKVLYFSQAFNAIDFGDFIPALIKSFFFGYIIGMVGCYKGYFAETGTEGVGKSANTAVVSASLAIFIIDMITVQVTNIFYN